MVKVRLLALALLATLAVPACRHVPPDPELTRLEEAAVEVTIVRDSYGVPHVYGPTDASVVFGLAYARAEDQFQLVEQYYAESVGRLAELLGPDHLVYDLLVRAFEVERHARAEYERLPPELAALCRGFADGVNYYLHTHPEVRPRLFDRFEPWFPLAGDRNFWSLYSLRNAPQRFGLLPDDLLGRLRPESAGRARPPSAAPGGQACNAWAIAPSRSATGHTMLLIDAHVELEPTYEFHVHSDEGLHVAGFANFGAAILPITGFNERLGWMLSENAPDWVDIYAETFELARPLAYRYGDGCRMAEWTRRLP
jgi:acyl-homoserine lactone acylase PvdQ